MYKLFVYGQLRKGQPLAEYMEHATFISNYKIYNFSVTEYSPTARFLEKDIGGEAVGELYLINDNIKKVLDDIEGVFKFTEIEPNLYAYIV